MSMKRFYMAAIIVGAALPIYFFGVYFAENGFGLQNLLGAVFANNAATGLGADLLVSAAAALVFILHDAAKRGLRHAWLFVPATFLIGLSFALPLYLYIRESRADVRRGEMLESGALSANR